MIRLAKAQYLKAPRAHFRVVEVHIAELHAVSSRTILQLIGN